MTRLLSVTDVTLRARPGVPIRLAAEDAVAVARRLGRDVTLTFNDIEIVVALGDTADEVQSRYDRMTRRREYHPIGEPGRE